MWGMKSGQVVNTRKLQFLNELLIFAKFQNSDRND